jgi:hypothetical protein
MLCTPLTLTVAPRRLGASAGWSVASVSWLVPPVQPGSAPGETPVCSWSYANPTSDTRVRIVWLAR